MCECVVSWIDVIVLTCIIVFFQFLMYKIGFSQGKQSVYNRLKNCNDQKF